MTCRGTIVSIIDLTSMSQWLHYILLLPLTDYGDGPTYTVPDFYSVTVLDSFIPILQSMQAAAQPLLESVNTHRC